MKSCVLQKADNDTREMYLLPTVYCITWAARDTEEQDASVTSLTPGFLPRSKMKMSSSWGSSRTTRLAARRKELPQHLPSPTSNHPHLHSTAPCQLCRDPHLSSNLLSRRHLLPCAYWQPITASFADCVSSSWEAGIHDRSCTRTTSLGAGVTAMSGEKHIQRKDY